MTHTQTHATPEQASGTTWKIGVSLGSTSAGEKAVKITRASPWASEIQLWGQKLVTVKENIVIDLSVVQQIDRADPELIVP